MKTTCANKTRQPGYWHRSHLGDTYIANTMSELCRHDQRMLTRECAGCMKPSDVDYLKQVGLWVPGVSHEVTE